MNFKLGLASFLVFSLLAATGCTSYIERLHKVRVTTDPPGAKVFELTEKGKHEIGSAPLQIERRYVDKGEIKPGVPIMTTVWGTIFGVVGGMFIGLAPSSTDGFSITGYALAGTGGIMLAAGFAYLIWGEPDDLDDDFVSYKLLASMPGYLDSEQMFTLGFSAGGIATPPRRSAPGVALLHQNKEAPVDVHITLKEKWWERYGMKEPPDKTSVAFIPQLRKALQDPKAIVRGEAAMALAAIGPTAKGANAELIVLMGDADVQVRKAAILALESIKTPNQQILDSLKRIFELDDDPATRDAARRALQKLSMIRLSTPEPETKTQNVPPKAPAVEITAVIDVSDSSGRFEEATLLQLTSYLGTALTRTGRYQVIPRERLRASLVEQKKESYRECMDESCQIELGKAVSANKMLSTQLLQVGSKCAVTANLYDLKTETMQKGAMVQTGCSPDELLDAMQRIVDQL